jgi:hypothetical protein
MVRNGMEGPDQLAALGRTLQQLLLASFGMHPEDLERDVADAVRHLGGDNLEILLCDYDQTVLVPFDASDERVLPIDGSAAGVSFRTDTLIGERVADGRRHLWVPVRDSSEREGVLGVSDDGSIADDVWHAVASLVGELIASKDAYGDHITLRKRGAPFSTPAEMRWGMLPPLTFTSPEVTVAGFLQPSHSIAGDVFDYAVTGRQAHVMIIDAMGHGLEASRMANVALGVARNGRRNGVSLIELVRKLDDGIATEFGDSRYRHGSDRHSRPRHGGDGDSQLRAPAAAAVARRRASGGSAVRASPAGGSRHRPLGDEVATAPGRLCVVPHRRRRRGALAFG